MADDAGLFVDRQEPLVLVDDVERNVLGHEFGRRRRWKNDLDHIARRRLVARLRGHAVDRDLALLDESLNRGAGDAREPPLKVFVQAATDEAFLDLDPVHLHRRLVVLILQICDAVIAIDRRRRGVVIGKL